VRRSLASIILQVAGFLVQETCRRCAGLSQVSLKGGVQGSWCCGRVFPAMQDAQRMQQVPLAARADPWAGCRCVVCHTCYSVSISYDGRVCNACSLLLSSTSRPGYTLLCDAQHMCGQSCLCAGPWLVTTPAEWGSCHGALYGMLLLQRAGCDHVSAAMLCCATHAAVAVDCCPRAEHSTPVCLCSTASAAALQQRAACARHCSVLLCH
jgi:hypothetical protein